MYYCILKNNVCLFAHRDKRVQDNWAMLHGQKLALAAKAPFAVVIVMPEEQVQVMHSHNTLHF